MSTQITVTAKPKRESQILWLNGLTIAGVIVSAAILGISDNALGIDPIIQARILFFLVIANQTITALLRLRTFAPISGSKGEQLAIEAEES